MTEGQNLLTLIARILLSLMFVLSGFGKIADFDGTVGYIASVGSADTSTAGGGRHRG